MRELFGFACLTRDLQDILLRNASKETEWEINQTQNAPAKKFVQQKKKKD